MDNTNLTTSSEKPRITRVFQLLDQAIEIFRKDLKNFLSMAIIVPLIGASPAIILYALMFLLGEKIPSVAGAVLTILLAIAAIFALFVFVTAQIGLILMQVEADRGKVKEIFFKASGYIGSYIFLILLVGVILFVLFLLLVIPGVIFYIYYYFAFYVLILEGKRGYAALKRSKELVKGYWWPVVGRLLFIGIIYLIIALIISIPFAFMSEGSIAYNTWSVINQIVQAALAPIAIIYNYLVFKDLTNIKTEKVS